MKDDEASNSVSTGQNMGVYNESAERSIKYSHPQCQDTVKEAAGEASTAAVDQIGEVSSASHCKFSQYFLSRTMLLLHYLYNKNVESDMKFKTEMARKDKIEICGDKIWQRRGYEAAHQLRSTWNLRCTTLAVFGYKDIRAEDPCCSCFHDCLEYD